MERRPDERKETNKPRRRFALAPAGGWREPINGMTHLAGAAASLAVLASLVVVAISLGKLRHLIGFAIFGLSLVALYTSSALYHLLPVSQRWIQRLRRIDHMMIFVLIAGTYTPFCLVALHGGWRWGLLGSIWGLALLGIVMKIWWMHAPVWLSTVLYVGVGSVAVIASPAIVRGLPSGGVGWLIAGGVVYIVGAIIYALERPVLWRGSFEAHELWHLFVMAGSGCHVWAAARYLPPLS